LERGTQLTPSSPPAATPPKPRKRWQHSPLRHAPLAMVTAPRSSSFSLHQPDDRSQAGSGMKDRKDTKDVLFETGLSRDHANLEMDSLPNGRRTEPSVRYGRHAREVRSTATKNRNGRCAAIECTTESTPARTTLLR
jgi:hypothetical protein